MAAKILLKKADVEEYRNISGNFNQDKFDAFALDIQRVPLREFLDDVLYNALINDLTAGGLPTATRFTDLVDGKEYEFNGDNIIYFGLKPFLSYHWLGLNVREGDYFQADYGNIQYVENPQDNMTKISQKTIDRINSGYMKNVTSYRNNIAQFLNENSSTYPEWNGKTENKSKTGFNMFTV